MHNVGVRLVVRFALAAALGAAALPAHAQNPTSSAIAAAQAGPAPANAALDLSSGEAIYKSGCITCHGPTGAGMPSTTVGFEQPDTFPDFTRCDQTTPELDIDYSAIIRDGGPARGC